MKINRISLLVIVYFIGIIPILSQDIQFISNESHAGKIRALSFFDQTDELISIGEDNSIIWWNPSTGETKDQKFLSLSNNAIKLYALSVSPDRNIIATAGLKGTQSTENKIYIIDAVTHHLETSIPSKSTNISSIEFNSDGTLLFTGDLNGVLHCWDISNLSDIKLLDELKLDQPINDISVSPDDKSFIVATDDISINKYKWSDNNQFILEKRLKKHFLGVNQITYTPDNQYIISAGQDNILNLFNSKGKFLRKIDKLENEITSMAISEDGKVLLVTTKNTGDCTTYSIPNGNRLTRFTDHNNTTYASTFKALSEESQEYMVATSGGNGNEILLWNAINGSTIKRIGKEINSIQSLELTDDNQLLVSMSATDKQYQFKCDLEHLNVAGTPSELITDKWPKAVKLLSPYVLKTNTNKIINGKDVDGRILSVVELADGSLVVGSDHSLKQYNADGSYIRELKGHTGGVRAITASDNFIITGGEDEVIHFWPVKLEKSLVEPQLSMILKDENNWVIWSSDGYFASEGIGASRFGWIRQVTSDEYPVQYSADQFFSLLFRPDEIIESLKTGQLVSDLMNKKNDRVFDLSTIQRPAAAFFEKPFATDKDQVIYLPSVNYSYNCEYPSVTIPMKALDGGSGIKEILVYQNDKLIKSYKEPKLENGKLSLDFNARLIPGENRFKVSATNLQGMISRFDQLNINYTGETVAVSDLYVFAIGINQYTNPSYNLNYAAPDAKAFMKKISERSEKIFNKIHTYSLYDDQAVKINIIQTFAEIVEKAHPQDVFVFYYAGHGVAEQTNTNEYFLVPHDITQIYGNNERLRRDGVSAEELKDLLAQIQAQKQLILLDACHSGEAVQTFASRGSSEEMAIIQLARSSGTVLLSASGTQQFAVEFEQLGHGVFTYSLLEALDGKADGGSRDNKITVNELKAYMEDRVPELSQKYGGSAQYPTGFSSGQDFPVSISNK